jgi:hypothetical protein
MYSLGTIAKMNQLSERKRVAWIKQNRPSDFDYEKLCITKRKSKQRKPRNAAKRG